MRATTRQKGLLVIACVATACADPTARMIAPPEATTSAVKFWEVTASTRWNRRSIELLALRPPANAQAAVSRMLAYLSIAQYRAVLAAEAGKDGRVHPSVAAAVGGASVAVLSSFFPLDIDTHESNLAADLAAEPWPGARHQDRATGEAIGRAVGAAVLALAATDNYLALPAPTPTIGDGYWVSSGAPIVRALHGARPFFLPSPSALRAPPPPAFGSPEFLAALAEVRAIADTRTPTQLALAVSWNTNIAPYTAGQLNLIVDDVIDGRHRTEREAARILAYGNAAAFDAQIACWDSKFHYWFLRPSQADAALAMAIGLPNHPSYPSGHSCLTGALLTVAADAFPSERTRLEAMIEEAGLSRVYGGIHYGFDVTAGRDIGVGAARLALSGRLE